MDSDQRHGFGRRRIAQPFDNTRLGQTHAALWTGLFRLDQLTVSGTMGRPFGNDPFTVRTLVDGDNPTTFTAFAENAHDTARVGPDTPDQPRLVVMSVFLDLSESGQNAVAFPQRGISGTWDHQHHWFHPFALPFHRLGKQIAILVRMGHDQHGHRRQPIRILIAALALFQMTVGLQLFEHALEVDTRRAFNAERLGDVTLGGQSGVFGDPVKDLGL